MKEKELIKVIKSIVGDEYIGDDCAYLKDLGIVITQDNMVEDVHFIRSLITPYQLGWKSVMINLSDVCASGAEPKYVTIALSLPKDIDVEYIAEFYKGAKDACSDVKIVGGDITGSDKVFISVTAIGSTKNRNISSRSHAKPGHTIIVSGNHGSSAAGLQLLLSGEKSPEKFIKSHLMPIAQCEFSKQISSLYSEDYAMMDSSDGLADVLSQIAFSSNVDLKIDFDKIPYDKDIEIFENYKDLILFGGEDYQLVATVPDRLLKNLTNYTIIGEVIAGNGNVFIDEKMYTPEDVEQKLFNHFKRQ